MGALQKVISQILTRLQDINMSQRVALLLGGALVAVSMIWLVQWASSPELVPLLDQDLSAPELEAIRGELSSLGEQYEVRGGRIYVAPSVDRTGLLASLQQRNALPANTSIGFANLIKESDPWVSQTENNRRWTYALAEELAGILRRFDGVQDAKVFLNLNTRAPSFTKLPPPSSASVTLITQGDGVPRALALAAARLVAGACAGLKVRDVAVVDAAGRSALDWESEEDPTNTLDRLRRRHEQHFTEKIARQIPDSKALVSVSVELDSTRRHTESQTPIQGTPVKEDTTSEVTERQLRSNQPGVQPNVGVAAGAGGAGESHTKDTSTIEYQVGTELKSEQKPPGEITLVTAAIRLSASYLENVFQRKNPDKTEPPTDGDLEEVFQIEKNRLLGQVVQLVRPQDEANVAIEWYWDMPVQTAGVGPVGTVDQTISLMRDYGPQSGLGLLALISLGLMLRMAKKSDVGEAFGMELGLPKDAIEAARMAAEDVASVADRIGKGGRRGGGRGGGGAGGGSDEEMAEIQQAAATEGMLVAQEVDAGTVQTRKMLDQVGEMVEEDPETVASLIDHWIDKNDQYHPTSSE